MEELIEISRNLPAKVSMKFRRYLADTIHWQNRLIGARGTVRESFNQLQVQHTVSYSEISDFEIDGKWLFEIGGKNKSRKQISGTSNGWLVKDDLEFPAGNAFPLRAFGFLY